MRKTSLNLLLLDVFSTQDYIYVYVLATLRLVAKRLKQFRLILMIFLLC